MGLRIERDPAFWVSVASHPEVSPHVLIGSDVQGLVDLIESPLITPLASEHGGFLFRNLDGMGLVLELHTLFTPDGWGREVALAARQAFGEVFDNGARVIVTHEQLGWWRSKPPKSHGWRPSGKNTHTVVGEVRLWVLSQDCWSQSPTGRRWRNKCP